MANRVIVLELNEVPWEILDDYVDKVPDSATRRLLAGSRTFTTITADDGHLSPWTTWPTLHRGVNDTRHMIAGFGQDRSRADRRFPPIWTTLRGAGLSVGICGTLQSYPPPDDYTSYAFYLPEPFAAEPIAHPPELVDFQKFNLTMSRESARNVDTGIAKKDALGVLAHSRRLGIRPQTYAALAKQLVVERRKKSHRNRRRTYQSVLLFDIFEHQLRATRPHFSSFFTNHVASAMHRYWAAHRPGDYDELELDDEWLATFVDEVMWATGQADAMLARLMRFVDSTPGFELWVASSMGQKATRAKALETQVYLTHPARFMQAMGLPDDAWQRRPAMVPQFNLFVDEAYVEAFRESLQSVAIDGKPLRFKRRSRGFFSIDFGQPNLHGRKDVLTLAGDPRPLRTLGLESVEIEDRSGTTAYHQPQGVLAIYDPWTDLPSDAGARREVSVLEVAPAWLEHFGLERPSYMVEPATLSGSKV